jgi:hypothetical protein
MGGLQGIGDHAIDYAIHKAAEDFAIVGDRFELDRGKETPRDPFEMTARIDRDLDRRSIEVRYGFQR